MGNFAIVIGHDKTSPGAYSPYLGCSEYLYNSEVASYLHQFDIYNRPVGGGYKTQMRKLAEQINGKGYDLVIELHFNSFNKEINGCETVSYPGNAYSKALGEKYCQLVTSQYKTENRGAKEATEGSRGWWFLALMDAPAIIAEPFFGDAEEALKFEHPGKYAEIIKQWLCS